MQAQLGQDPVEFRCQTFDPLNKPLVFTIVTWYNGTDC